MSAKKPTTQTPSSDGPTTSGISDDGAEPMDGVEIVDAEIIEPADIRSMSPDEALQHLTAELEAARKSEAEYLDRLQRVTAEFDNFRKRSIREQAQLRELGSERVLSSMLPTLDSFDAAMAVPVESETEQRLLDGMVGTYNQLMEAVGREGLEPIPALGKPFDPSVHEAISAPPNASGPLVVVAEIRRGYKLKDRVLRPSLVALDLAEDSGDDASEPQDEG